MSDSLQLESITTALMSQDKPPEQKTPQLVDVRKCPGSSDCLNEPRAMPQSLLSDKQQAALELLLLGKSFAAISRNVQIDVRTLHRWRQDQDFCDEFARRRREQRDLADERL